MNQNKVMPTHLRRLAIVYVRQSSPQQVIHNIESQQRQYQLVERSQALGWSSEQSLVIDEDQGVSGAQSYNRPGYQRLTAMIALREVGIIFGLEVSRLARNNLDWYQLLEVAAAFDVLIADEDGIYDPGNFNDRLLLGLKGTISEVELHQIRARLLRGRINKAQRGELRMNLPVGLDWDANTKKARLSVDQRVRHAIALVFRLFRQIGSLRGVLRYLRREELELPYQTVARLKNRKIVWRRPSYEAIWGIITNPAYAGVYCYGKTHTQVDPLNQRVHVRRLPRHKWQVFLPDHHSGYITLAEFDENQHILQNNRTSLPQSQGAVRGGATLLQGLVFCQHCGRKMSIRYCQGVPYYMCVEARNRYGDPICNRVSAKRADALVIERFLAVIHEGMLECSRSYHKKLSHEITDVERGWQEKLKCLTYEAELTQRRYEMVDPANRLVSQTLESEWNERLVAIEVARHAYETQKPTPAELRSTAEQMQSVIAHFQDYWECEYLTNQDKKELIRCLIERVFLNTTQDKMLCVQIYWYGGAMSAVEIPKHLWSDPKIFQRIRELAQTQTDGEIAAKLNQEDLLSVTGKSWTSERVYSFRTTNAIPSRFTTDPALRIPDPRWVTSTEAATRLDVSQAAIQKWFRQGILAGRKNGPFANLWLHWSEELVQRLKGNTPLKPGMISVRSLCQERDQTPKDIFRWARSRDYEICRLRKGSRFQFYILPTKISRQLK
jgi:DNA invertase Pin-like site-specific DNA recombinase